MGNRRVVREIVASLEQEQPERVLRISAWVLAEIYGPDAAKTVIEKAAAGASGPKKTSLDWVRRILDEKGVLLPAPTRG
jgi:hypothetical protein